MAEDFVDRLDALERTLADDSVENSDDGTHTTDPRVAATRSEDLLRLERRVDDLEATVDELEAAVQAVRGYAGNVRAVNRDVERRASAALAKAEALETAVGSRTTATSGPPPEPDDVPSHDDGDLSREPTVIAEDSDSDDGSADQGDDSTDTDRFVQRVRDAI